MTTSYAVAATQLLGLAPNTPRTLDEMLRASRVTLFPNATASQRARSFAEDICRALEALGVTRLGWDAATAPDGSLAPNVSVLAPGPFENGRLPVDSVQNLGSNTLIGVYDTEPVSVAGAAAGGGGYSPSSTRRLPSSPATSSRSRCT